MATRAIVTSHPVVACDVCGRRLLRGESPDVFLAGGQRRTVCELCVPRAAAEGWLREADDHASSVRPTRSRRAGSLLGRLRQLREPAQRPLRREGQTPAVAPDGSGGGEPQEEDLGGEELYDFLEGGALERAEPYERELYIGSVQAGEPPLGEWTADLEDGPAASSRRRQEARMSPEHPPQPARDAPTSGELKVARALAVFNAGEQPRRVAGVARSLGAPTVAARALEESGSTVAIVVAWELCWYRYEVDLGDEAAGPRLVAQGMELDELPAEDRLANAAADERGELAVLSA
ncbi:MAG TPA: hypothetical protein VK672_05945 [Solirubrobacteraceae bacterium]|jgi:hypothetical protein|nr:hypothetical protein [Solirubrobacteraceae bacterium]